MRKKLKYEISDHVKWTTDMNCIKIYDGITHQTKTLFYPEAALWDLILQQYSEDETVAMMAAIIKKNAPETRKWINNTLDDWIGVNLLKQ